jgi:hypothetical protein
VGIIVSPIASHFGGLFNLFRPNTMLSMPEEAAAAAAAAAAIVKNLAVCEKDGIFFISEISRFSTSYR